MKSSLLFILAIIFISCNSQSSNPTDSSFDKSKLQGNTFSNDYFGFQLEIDTPWHILNKQELTQLINERLNTINETNDKNFTVTKGANILLSLAIDTIENMPHILLSSLDLTMSPQIKNEKDYLDDYFKQVKKMYENYDVQISNSEIGQEAVASKTFFANLITIKAENFLAYQKRYSIKLNDKLLNIMINYRSETDLKQCSVLLNNIKWR
jgi:hypothetical protein